MDRVGASTNESPTNGSYGSSLYSPSSMALDPFSGESTAFDYSVSLGNLSLTSW